MKQQVWDIKQYIQEMLAHRSQMFLLCYDLWLLQWNIDTVKLVYKDLHGKDRKWSLETGSPFAQVNLFFKSVIGTNYLIWSLFSGVIYLQVVVTTVWLYIGILSCNTWHNNYVSFILAREQLLPRGDTCLHKCWRALFHPRAEA